MWFGHKVENLLFVSEEPGVEPNLLVECTNTLRIFIHNLLFLKEPPQSIETCTVSFIHYMKYFWYFYSQKLSVVTYSKYSTI
jgi:hypothetical protein